MNATQTVQAIASRHVSAPPERVFDAFLDPDLVKRWMAVSTTPGELGELKRVSLDGHPGGTFSFVDAINGEELEHVGEYREIERPHRLVFTWSLARNPDDVSLVTVDIVPMNSGSGVTLTQEMGDQWTEYINRVVGAWTRKLDSLNAVLSEE
jgi:uncharacterized protein YndB with AHSA1/START domain